MTQRLLVATTNKGKMREIAAAFAGKGFNLQSLIDYPDIPPIAEEGANFKENALIKARAVHEIVGGYVLADDSGLECEDLHGAPGIHSARFAGDGASDEANNQKLVRLMQAMHDPSRRARYVCVFAFIDPQGQEKFFEGTCEGMITLTPGGSQGFGYDPYFYLPKYRATMAELPLVEKNKISHRGKALQALVDAITESTK